MDNVKLSKVCVISDSNAIGFVISLIAIFLKKPTYSQTDYIV